MRINDETPRLAGLIAHLCISSAVVRSGNDKKGQHHRFSLILARSAQNTKFFR